jgi:hypothetical protein
MATVYDDEEELEESIASDSPEGSLAETYEHPAFGETAGFFATSYLPDYDSQEESDPSQYECVENSKENTQGTSKKSDFPSSFVNDGAIYEPENKETHGISAQASYEDDFDAADSRVSNAVLHDAPLQTSLTHAVISPIPLSRVTSPCDAADELHDDVQGQKILVGTDLKATLQEKQTYTVPFSHNLQGIGSVRDGSAMYASSRDHYKPPTPTLDGSHSQSYKLQHASAPDEDLGTLGRQSHTKKSLEHATHEVDIEASACVGPDDTLQADVSRAHVIGLASNGAGEDAITSRTDLAKEELEQLTSAGPGKDGEAWPRHGVSNTSQAAPQKSDTKGQAQPVVAARDKLSEKHRHVGCDKQDTSDQSCERSCDSVEHVCVQPPEEETVAQQRAVQAAALRKSVRVSVEVFVEYCTARRSGHHVHQLTSCKEGSTLRGAHETYQELYDRLRAALGSHDFLLNPERVVVFSNHSCFSEICQAQGAVAPTSAPKQSGAAAATSAANRSIITNDGGLSIAQGAGGKCPPMSPPRYRTWGEGTRTVMGNYGATGLEHSDSRRHFPRLGAFEVWVRVFSSDTLQLVASKLTTGQFPSGCYLSYLRVRVCMHVS